MMTLMLGSDLLEETLPMAMVLGTILVLGLAGIFAVTARGIHRTREKERTRREVAAYVSEGTMSPEDAERILEAGMTAWQRGRGWWSGGDGSEWSGWSCASAAPKKGR